MPAKKQINKEIQILNIKTKEFIPKGFFILLLILFWPIGIYWLITRNDFYISHEITYLQNNINRTIILTDKEYKQNNVQTFIANAKS